MPLVLLDRDGVINRDSDDYIRGPADWEPIPGSIEAIASLSKAGYQLAVITNQSGLSRGYFGLDELEAIHAKLYQQVEEQGGSLAGIFYCPHSPDQNCGCRKPATGLLLAAEQALGMSAKGALFIGDSLKDLQAARAHGCLPVLVRTGKGEATLVSLQGAHVDLGNADQVAVFDDLAAVARAIIDGELIPGVS
jgi:D-glycero-D-manno-heptose 1,7-bisphosphate phosphatase